MSQIKKALDKARAERLNREMVDIVPKPHVVSAEELPDSLDTSFEFTRTRIVEVPWSTLLKNRILNCSDKNCVSDSLKMLRTHIFQSTRQKMWNLIQITGFGAGEGTSFVAANLAINIAKDTRQTTLLVDLNFRSPNIGRLFSLDGPGLKSYFLDDLPLEELLVSPGIQKLSILTTGGTIENPSELLGSPKMEALMMELKRRYPDRYVILDTPAISKYPDPLVISEYVDSILFVARLHHTSQESIKFARERIPKEKILGLVVNDALPDELIK